MTKRKAIKEKMTKKIDETIFRSYDIRGEYPKDLDRNTAYLIAKGYGSFLKKAQTIVVGRDIRDSSQEINKDIIKGLIDSGKQVIDIGQVSTEMIYFAVNYLDADGGLALTASHNPAGWAGVKMVREKAIPISDESGIREIKDRVLKKDFIKPLKKGSVSKKDIKKAYHQKLLSLIDKNKLKPLKIVVNALNGVAGETSKKLLDRLPIELIKVDFDPQPTFPKGEPDPLLPKRRIETSKLTEKYGADMGASFDGDGDRCLFFDERGQFIKGSYIVALLAEHILNKNNNKGNIITDCRLYWPAKEVVKKAGGNLIINKPGHTYLKQAMRDYKALFAGEISGHFYYQNYYYADSGLLTLLYFLELLSKSKKPLSKIVKPLTDKYPASDEINFQAENKEEIINKAKENYGEDGEIEEISGVGITLNNWRFNLRPSGTEPKIRLNLEAKNKKTLDIKEQELIDFIKNLGAKIS
jgi:phosphomannomutase